MKSIECEFGKIEYRYPNIPEACELLGAMGINSSTAQDADELAKNDIVYVGRLIKSMAPVITKIDIKMGGKKVKDYNELLNHFKMMKHLIIIATDVMKALDLEGEKKAKMRECTQLMLRKVSLEHLKEVSEKGYNNMKEMVPYLYYFNLYSSAYHIGVRFGPHDLDVDITNMLSAIKGVVTENEMNKKGK